MSERLLTPRTYIVVFLLLAAMTVLTVWLSFVPSTPVMRVVAGQGIAAIKASLVALFFMHALGSAAQTKAVIIVTCFWFLVLLALTFSDYITRGFVPRMPGH